jgi:hypothetical protein
LRLDRFEHVIVRESANQSVEDLHGNGRTMMMNERVEIGRGAVQVAVAGEKLVTLHRTLKRIAKARAHLDLQEAEALREAQRVQLWRQFGHVSLADYMVQELGYASHRVAEDRLRLANALPDLPKISEAIQNGEINFSQARELVRVATPQNEQAWLGKAKEMNVREVERAVAGHQKGDLPEDPVDPRLVRKTLWLSVRPETEVMFREAKRALEKERGEKLDEDAVMEALCRAFLAGARVADVGVRAADVGAGAGDNDLDSHPRGCEEGSSAAKTNDGAAPYRVAVTVCTECKRGWQHGGGAVEEMTPAAVERAQCDAQWIGDLDSDEVERARQEIPPATRRKVLHRDQRRCQVPGCSCHTNLDVHHIVHREHGGTNELGNLITLCEAHHLCHHEGTLGLERVGGELKWRREGRDNFTRASREVATRRALHERKFDREEIAEIMRRTVTHVGLNVLSDEQWLAIALRYAGQVLAPRPATSEEQCTLPL